MAEKKRGTNVLQRVGQGLIRVNRTNSQNEDVYPEKVEMVVDLAEETPEPTSFRDDRSV